MDKILELIAAKYPKVLASIQMTGPKSAIIRDSKGRISGAIEEGVLTPKFAGRQALMGSLIVREIKAALRAKENP